MTVATLAAPDFNLDLTLASGQVFHWKRKERGYIGVIAGKPLFVGQDGESLLVSAGCEELASRYFALDHPLPQIYKTFPTDPTMSRALETCRGLRIIRQPAWECLATFITSSLKQVPHIRQISHAIRETFGSPVRLGRETLHAYPAAEALARATEEQLRACRLGYRAKNLLATARVIASGGVDLAGIEAMDDEAALARLCELPGVGPKIANCVLLFAYGRLRAFPIDVWIGRVLRENYFKRKRKVTEKRMQIFSNSYFGEFGGYAQQYLFHHARTAGR